jgi:hypothetical protein
MPTKTAIFPNDEIRTILLRYFYSRNRNATSARSDKSGVTAKISVVRRDLKGSHGLTASQVRSNLTYLISQGWITEEQVTKSVPLKTGIVIPQATTYYKITAAGIDKIEGPGAFTMDKFKGIRIEATGQNIITVGDGNQVDAKFASIADALARFKQDVRATATATEQQKLEIVADIESIQSQLAKRAPNKGFIQQIWAGVERTATLIGLTANAVALGKLLAGLQS